MENSCCERCEYWVREHCELDLAPDPEFGGCVYRERRIKERDEKPVWLVQIWGKKAWGKKELIAEIHKSARFDAEVLAWLFCKRGYGEDENDDSCVFYPAHKIDHVTVKRVDEEETDEKA